MPLHRMGWFSRFCSGHGQAVEALWSAQICDDERRGRVRNIGERSGQIRRGLQGDAAGPGWAQCAASMVKRNIGNGINPHANRATCGGVVDHVSRSKNHNRVGGPD